MAEARKGGLGNCVASLSRQLLGMSTSDTESQWQIPLGGAEEERRDCMNDEQVVFMDIPAISWGGVGCIAAARGGEGAWSGREENCQLQRKEIPSHETAPSLRYT